ncbi:MAG: enoyl-CoA hydratase/isomerase family protein, partial [Parvularculaceae bacterium]|nr:enoyl-CoA hydratase/isomerase family protein [Parvularculaceae bacterium]
MAYETILTEIDDGAGIITLNRPKALNAFNRQLMDELTGAVKAMEKDDRVGCLVITGSEKAFAAGADIKEMAGKSYMDVFMEDFITANWEEASK